MLVIGSGIAGMSTALHLSKMGKVTMLTKTKLISGSTPLAQGGIAGVINPKDSFEKHIHDTIKVGGFTNNKSTVEILVKNAPQEIHFLRKLGVPFEKDQHLEGGHSFPRVSNVKDISGKIIAETLAFHVLSNKNINIIENAEVLSLEDTTCNFKKIIFRHHINNSNIKKIIRSKYVVFATGGYSSLYNASTSPKDNLGDGISICLNAKIKTKDLDKVQFHPTVFKINRKKNQPQLLLTEAIRGFGARIINQDEDKIIDALQPRDVVSRAIYIAEKNGDNVFLDARNIENFSKHFPYVSSVLQKEFNMNAEKDLLPITFGAHYCMGGIETDINGETSVKNIYAVGECANTGVHGNNRLASNSLLEGVVFARQIAKHITKKQENNLNNLEILEKVEDLECIEEIEEINKISENTELNNQFLDIIKNTLSQYLSIETDLIKKRENIKLAQEIFQKFENKKSELSQKNQNILLLVQNLAQDAKRNV